MKTILLFLFVNVICVGQTEIKNLTDGFVSALKIADTQQGEKMLAEMSLRELSSIPIISKADIVNDVQFDTDISGVKGYKAVMEVHGANGYGSAISKRYLLIAYKVNDAWKVFDFRQNLDVDYEVVEARKTINSETDSRKMQHRLRGLSYWLAMDGKISEAREVAEQAFKAAQADNDVAFINDIYTIVNAVK